MDDGHNASVEAHGTVLSPNDLVPGSNSPHVSSELSSHGTYAGYTSHFPGANDQANFVGQHAVYGPNMHYQPHNNPQWMNECIGMGSNASGMIAHNAGVGNFGQVPAADQFKTPPNNSRVAKSDHSVSRSTSRRTEGGKRASSAVTTPSLTDRLSSPRSDGSATPINFASPNGWNVGAPKSTSPLAQNGLPALPSAGFMQQGRPAGPETVHRTPTRIGGGLQSQASFQPPSRGPPGTRLQNVWRESRHGVPSLEAQQAAREARKGGYICFHLAMTLEEMNRLGVSFSKNPATAFKDAYFYIDEGPEIQWSEFPSPNTGCETPQPATTPRKRAHGQNKSNNANANAAPVSASISKANSNRKKRKTSGPSGPTSCLDILSLSDEHKKKPMALSESIIRQMEKHHPDLVEPHARSRRNTNLDLDRDAHTVPPSPRKGKAKVKVPAMADSKVQGQEEAHQVKDGDDEYANMSGSKSFSPSSSSSLLPAAAGDSEVQEGHEKESGDQSPMSHADMMEMMRQMQKQIAEMRQ